MSTVRKPRSRFGWPPAETAELRHATMTLTIEMRGILKAFESLADAVDRLDECLDARTKLWREIEALER
jgi:hypothetical protein